MPDTDEQQQLEVLANVLEEMRSYLPRLVQGCEELVRGFHSVNKAKPLTNMSQILEGLGYCPKLMQSATLLLNIDITEKLSGEVSIASFIGEIYRIFQDIHQAVDSEDYSMVADLVEYDLVPSINTAQELFGVLQRRLTERVG